MPGRRDRPARIEATEGRLQRIESKEEHAETHYRLTEGSAPTFAHDPGRHAQGHGRQRERLQFDVQADQRDDPRGQGGADIGAKHYPHRLSQAQQAGVDETNGGEHHRTRTLHQCGDQHSGGHGPSKAAGGGTQQAAQGRAGSDLQPVAHQPHAEQEQANAASELADRFKAHAFALPGCICTKRKGHAR